MLYYWTRGEGTFTPACACPHADRREDILHIYEAGTDAVVQLVVQLKESLLAATTTIAQLQLRIEALEAQLSAILSYGKKIRHR